MSPVRRKWAMIGAFIAVRWGDKGPQNLHNPQRRMIIPTLRTERIPRSSETNFSSFASPRARNIRSSFIFAKWIILKFLDRNFQFLWSLLLFFISASITNVIGCFYYWKFLFYLPIQRFFSWISPYNFKKPQSLFVPETSGQTTASSFVLDFMLNCTNTRSRF